MQTGKRYLTFDKQHFLGDIWLNTLAIMFSFFLVIVAKAQNSPDSFGNELDNGELYVTLNIDNEFSGNSDVLLVSLNYDAGGSCADINGATNLFTFQVDYHDAIGNVSTTIKTFDFYAYNESATQIGWHPSIFTNYFIVSPPCPNLLFTSMQIHAGFSDAVLSASCYFSLDCTLNNGQVADTDESAHIVEFTTALTGTSSLNELNFQVFPNGAYPQPYYCGIGQTAFVAPYGGCPPYNITWLQDGAPITLPQPSSVQFPANLCPSETIDVPITGTDAENIFLNPTVGGTYAIQVQDAEANTVEQTYTFSNGIENQIDFTYTIESHSEGGKIHLDLLLTPFGQLLNYFPLTAATQTENNANWLALLSNTDETICDISSLFIEPNKIAINLASTPNHHYPTGEYKITLYNTHTGCSIQKEVCFDVSDLNLLWLNGDFFSCDGSPTTLTLNSNIINLTTSTISWSEGIVSSGTNIQVNPSGGTYTVTVTDNNGNETSKEFTITIASAPTITLPEGVEFCLGEAISLNPQISSGEGEYSYQWSTDETTPDIVVATPGTYSVTVTDANGCTASASTTVTVNSALQVAFDPPTPVLCSYDALPSVTGIGGLPPYSTTIFENSDNYYVMITDVNGCTASATIPISQEPEVDIIAAPPADCAVLLTATPLGDTPPYEFIWIPNEENGAYLTATAPGTYAVVVTDDNGCTAQNQITLPEFTQPANFTGNYMAGTTTPPLPDADPNPDIEEWNTGNLRIAGSITVPAGKTLRITGIGIEMSGNENSYILVEPGATLELTNATIKAAACLPNTHYWKGISVLGSDVPYSSIDFDTEAATVNYGVLIATGSKIENAQIGACSGLLTNTSYIAQTGGLLRLHNTEFTDNGIAVKLEKFAASNHQVHDIQNCTVKLTQNAPPASAPQYWWPADVGQPVGLWAAGSKLVNPLHNNRFNNTSPMQLFGIGMRLNNVAAAVTANAEPDPDNPAQYEFSGLYKGIDAYNTLTVMKNVNISNQNFQTTQKSITLNGTVGSQISENTFSVPSGLSQTEDAYGLYSFGSIGLTVEKNSFLSQQQTNNPYTYGAIIDNSYYEGFQSHLNNNLFDGRLKPATQFIGYNNRLYTNCNAYDDCDIDWHLTPNATLPQQGDCFSGLASDALRTHWHYTNELGSTIGYTNYHIINEAAFLLELKIDDDSQSEPTNILGLVVVQPCSALTGMPTDNNSCVVPIPEFDMGMADCNSEGDIERRIYSFLRLNQRDSLLELLHCLDTDWAIRLLVGTYVDERLYEQALAELQRLPNTPQNVEFIALYTAIIEGGLEGSGKSSTATATVSAIAQNALSGNNVLAQSVLAVYKGADYIRHGEPVNLKHSPIYVQPDFDIAPNPTSNVVNINIIKPVSENRNLLVYRPDGQLVLNVIVSANSRRLTLDTQQLHSGIYFCKLTNSNSTAKLVIVK